MPDILELVKGIDSLEWFIGVSCFCAFVASTISLIQVATHIKRYTVPDQQRCIVRIIIMIPIYCIFSLLALFLPDLQVYFGLARDSYEAYALYCFFSLCLEYGKGWKGLSDAFSQHPSTRLLPPFWCFVQPKKRWLVICRAGILQYTLIKPIVAVISVFLLAFGLYNEGEWRTDKGYLYCTIINNICVSVSLYFLAFFYKVAADELKPYKPVLKFACIKLIVFFCYWQSVAIAIAVGVGWIQTRKNWTESEVGTVIMNGMVCIEMLIFSIMHLVAFPSDLYLIRAMSQAPLIRDAELQEGGYARAMADVTKQTDLMKDTFHTFVPKAIRNLSKARTKETQFDSRDSFELSFQPRLGEEPMNTFENQAALQDAIFRDQQRSVYAQTRQRQEQQDRNDRTQIPDDLPGADESKR